MLMTILMYGLIVCALLQPTNQHRAAAWTMAVGVMFVEISSHFGVMSGHAYYLYAIVVAICVVIILQIFKSLKLVSGLFNACAAMIIINSTDWVLYAYSSIISDAIYEGIFVLIYMYVWFVMLGKGGADVVGRFKQFRAGVRNVHNTSSVKQRGSDHNKV